MNDVVLVTNEMLDGYLAIAAPDLNSTERTQFFQIAHAFNLNPFKREIYAIPYGQGDQRKLSIITGYEVYLKRAESTDKLDGWSVETKGHIEKKKVVKVLKKRDGGTWNKDIEIFVSDPMNPCKATVTIYRKDRSKPFVWDVDFDEYAQDQGLWITKPLTMIKKVAIAQAFRLCFPEELNGIPYTADELPTEMGTVTHDIKPQMEVRQPAPKAPPTIEQIDEIINIAKEKRGLSDELICDCLCLPVSDWQSATWEGLDKVKEECRKVKALTEAGKAQ